MIDLENLLRKIGGQLRKELQAEFANNGASISGDMLRMKVPKKSNNAAVEEAVSQQLLEEVARALGPIFASLGMSIVHRPGMCMMYFRSNKTHNLSSSAMSVTIDKGLITLIYVPG